MASVTGYFSTNNQSSVPFFSYIHHTKTHCMKRLSLLLMLLNIFASSNAQLQSNLMAADSIFSGPYALVAGGSKGIGYAIAEALAKRGFNLILIARHEDSLLSAKAKLESNYHIGVNIKSGRNCGAGNTDRKIDHSSWHAC